MPDALRQLDQDDREFHERVIQDVLDWDETAAYRYDHRWVYQHGSGAYIALMGPEQAEAAGLQEHRDPVAEPGALCLPERLWPELRQRAREHFLRGLDERIQRPAFVQVAEGTACGPQLQQDVLERIRTLAGRSDGDLGRVLSAKVLEASTAVTYFGIGRLTGSWRERWHVEQAGTTEEYEIEVQPDGQGGTNFTLERASE